MKSVSTLQELRRRVLSASLHTQMTPNDIVELIDQAIEDRQTINRWFGFLRLMGQRSSWSGQINDLLNEYLYGTADKTIQDAAQRYLDRIKLHDRTLNK